MSKPTKSRHGLTRCTVCRAHIEAAERPSETDCPFCGANLHRSRGRVLPTGRGGILAASLLAFSATACGGGDDASDGDTTVEPGDDTSGGNDNAGNDNGGNDNAGDDGYDDTPPDDPGPIAEYGMPPDQYEGGAVDDSPDEPMYGVPPE